MEPALPRPVWASVAEATVETLLDASSEAAATAEDCDEVPSAEAVSVRAAACSWPAAVDTEPTMPPTARSKRSASSRISASR